MPPFVLPTSPFPKDPGTNAPYIAVPDNSGYYALPAANYVKNEAGTLWVPVTSANPMYVKAEAIETLLGALNATASTDPTAAASQNAFLKGLIKILADVWDDAGNGLRFLSNFEASPGFNPTKYVQIGGQGGIRPQGLKADGIDPDVLDVAALGYRFNGATWDKERGNIEGVLLSVAARTATATSPVQVNQNNKVIIVSLKVNSVSGTGGLQPRIIARVDAAGTYGEKFINTPIPTITEIGAYYYAFALGLEDIPGDMTDAFNFPLPRSWYMDVVHLDGSSYTYGAAYTSIV